MILNYISKIVCFFYFILLKFFFIFSERRKGGRKRGRETLIWYLSQAPNQGLGQQQRHVPIQESNRQPFGSQISVQYTEQHQPGLIMIYLCDYKKNCTSPIQLYVLQRNNQTHIKQLKKEKERAQGEIACWLSHCKMMEEGMEQLQKELCRLEEAAQEKQKAGGVSWAGPRAQAGKAWCGHRQCLRAPVSYCMLILGGCPFSNFRTLCSLLDHS